MPSTTDLAGTNLAASGAGLGAWADVVMICVVIVGLAVLVWLFRREGG